MAKRRPPPFFLDLRPLCQEVGFRHEKTGENGEMLIRVQRAVCGGAETGENGRKADSSDSLSTFGAP